MDAFRLLELLILVAVLAGFVGLLIRRNLFLKVLAMDVMGSAVVALFVLLAATGFWQFLAAGHWPWLAAAIASVTSLVFWAVGGADRPALAILVAGLVMLGSSALGMLAARRRKAAITSGAGPPPVG